MAEHDAKSPTTFSPVFDKTKWIFFDLDDTLHSYRPAASNATKCVLDTIIAQHPQLNLADLHASYKYIVSTGSDKYFTNGRTSHEYRGARFTSLLKKYDVDVDVQELLDIYEKSITAELKLKPHAIDLLRTLKEEEKRIAIVSEGPHDAQERAVSTLSLGTYIDHLATSNRSGISKSDGLFEKVAEDLGVNKDEVVVIGDSWDKDVQPVIRLGMRAVWVDEAGTEAGAGPEEQFEGNEIRIVRVTTLGELLR